VSSVIFLDDDNLYLFLEAALCLKIDLALPTESYRIRAEGATCMQGMESGLISDFDLFLSALADFMNH
jgi:hypothetical protein